LSPADRFLPSALYGDGGGGGGASSGGGGKLQ